MPDHLLRWFPRMRSLHGRLLLLLLSMMLVVWLVAALLTWSSAAHELDELLDGHLAQSAALLVAQQTGHGQDETNEYVTHDAPDMPYKYAPRVAFQVFHEGKLTLHSSNTGAAPMARVLRGFETVTRPDGVAWRVFAAQGNEGDVQVYVGEQVTSRESILWAVLQSLLTPLLLALPVLGVFGWLMVRHALQPLRELGQVLAKRQPQSMEAIVLSDVPAEMEPVLQALNQLLERISHMLTAERRFTADAAHELRTPIAAIRMQAQVALGADDDDTPGRTRALQQTLAGCDRATHLVEQLLTLSRLESSTRGAPGGQVNLSALAQRVAADLALTALQRRQTLSLEAAQPALIAADDTLTGVLLRNLLDNALRYSPADAKVCVSVDLIGTQVCLQVDDSGPGLPDADLARLGERFFRVLGTGQSGSGLGWSIVRRIALVYHADVSVQRSARLGGLCVRVVWPAAVPTVSAPGR